MVFGTAFSKFQTKVSKSNDLSKDCEGVVGLDSASSCCDWIKSDRFCDFDFTLLEASPRWSALSTGHASNVEDGDRYGEVCELELPVLLLDRVVPEDFLAFFAIALFSSRKTRSKSSGYPGHTRADFLQLPHVGRFSSHFIRRVLHIPHPRLGLPV